MTDIYVWIVLAGFMNSLIHGGLCQIEVFREKRSSHGDEEEHGEEDGGNETSGHSDHSSIINSLFKKYDPTASPTHGSDEPTIITVNVLVLSMDEINDSKMEYVIDTRMTFSWYDKRLKTENCKEENSECEDRFDMKGRADKMWFPDLYILNARLATNHDQPLKNGMVYLKASGDVMLSKRLTLTLRCPMDLTLYPMDTQKCPIIICPYSLTESELKLTWMPNGVSMLEDFQLLQSFMLIPPVMTGQMKWRYDGPDVSGLFSCVNATFQLSRLNGYHIAYSYTVTTFIVMVSWISFWLPVTAVPARVTLGITTLLTLITTANYLRTSLPPIAYVTALDLWVGFCTLFVFASLILYPVSYCRAQKKSLENQAIILKVENTVCPLSSKCKLCGGIKDKLLKLPAKEDIPESGLDKICRTIFPVCFVVLIITYTISFITKTQNAP